MAVSIAIARVRRADGKLSVQLSSKRGFIFNSAADAQAILDQVREAIGEEALTVLAIKKVGAANAELLEGRTVTLTFDVVVT